MATLRGVADFSRWTRFYYPRVAILLALTLWAPAPDARAGDGFFTLSASTATESLDVTAIDADTLLPLPGTFTSDADGWYEQAGLIVLDGDTADPLGSFLITGQGDPHLRTRVTLNLPPGVIAASGFTMFVSMIAGIDARMGDPDDEVDFVIRSVQTTTTTGSPGTPAGSPQNATTVFLETDDGKSANATGAGVSGPFTLPSITFLDSGLAAFPPLPPNTLEDRFSVLVTQNDLALFDMAADADLVIHSDTRTDIFPLGVFPADYNDDGVIDAADYTAWRDAVGSPAGTLPNDELGGPIGHLQHRAWAANYGLTEPVPASHSVPEPTALLTGLLGLAPLARARICAHR